MTALAAPADQTTPPAARAEGRSFRPDVEVLRAFAVLSVLVYHLVPRWLPGGFAGVDVFFVISGFLITSHLMGELRRAGRLSLARFYGRRITRLLPASTLVLVVTALGTVLLAPRFVWRQFGLDTAFAGSYSLNWALAARSVDYLAEDSVPSAVQHYWSLAVEEQFYLLWPVLLVAAAALATRRSWSRWRAAAVAAAVVALVSFALAALQVRADEPSAYFTTTTRLWELAVGALLALGAAWLQRRLTSWSRALLVGVGLLALVGSVLLLHGDGWPAGPALVPTLGAAALILGVGGPDGPPLRPLLAAPALVWVGGISYSLYLWHWPLITLAHYRWADFSALQVLALGLVSVVLAWASQRLVENPLRFSGWFKAAAWRPFALAALCLLLSVAAGLGLVLAGPSSSLAAPSGAQPRGAAVLPQRIDLDRHPAWSEGVQWVLPAPSAAVDDVPVAYADGCQQSATDAAPISCTYGDRGGARTLALVGDSKALQWLPALDTWAQGHGFALVTFVKSSCPFADTLVDVSGKPYPSCRDWNAAVLEKLTALHPALVVTSQVRAGASPTLEGEDRGPALMTEALQRTWRTLTDASIPVAVLGDTPQTGANVYECVAEHPDQLDRCAYDRATAVHNSALPTQLAAVRALGGSVLDASGASVTRGSNRALTLIDLDDAVCPDARRCPPVVGNVLIYRSGSHLTKTYVNSLTPRLSGLLDRAV